MPKYKTASAKAAGILISSIQKEWQEEVEPGSKNADNAENKMNLVHDLLRAVTANEMKKILGMKTVKRYHGMVWLESHPNIKTSIRELEKTIENETT